MAGWQLRARTVARSKQFEKQAAALVSDAQRCDEVFEGIEWAVATNPEHHTEIPGTRLRIIKTNPFETSEIPEMRVYFTIDDDNMCTLQWVEVIEPGEPDS